MRRNPYATYEIYIPKTPIWVPIAAILLSLVCIAGVIYLSVTSPEPVIPASAFRVPKAPKIPDVNGRVQRSVDQALTGKTEAAQ